MPGEQKKSAANYDLITMGRSSIDLYSNDIGTPFEEIESFGAFVGGSPTNIAVGAVRLGLRTALLTAVGEDPVGDFILHFLSNEGVETQFIPRKPGTRTSAVILGIEPPDKFPLVYYRDNAADIQLSIDDVLAAPVSECRAFEFAGTNLARDPSRSATIFAAERAKGAGATIFLDLDFRADQWDDPRAFGVAIRSILPMVDVAIGTEEEIKAAMLKDIEEISITDSQISSPEISGDLQLAVQNLLARGPQTLIVKQGERGAEAFLQDGKVQQVPGFHVEVVNVLGAGDAFASGLIFGRLKEWGWYKALRMANACGAILVTRQGVANFMPSEGEVFEFVEKHGGF